MLAETEIKFACSECGQALAVAPEGAGLSTSCPSCSNLVTVPFASTRDRGASFTGQDEAPGAAKVSRGAAPERDLQALREKLLQSGLAVGRLERSLAEAQSDGAKLRRQLESAAVERDTSLAAAVQAGQELDRLRAEQVALKGDLDFNRQRLGATETHLAARERELAEITASIARTGAEAEAARNAAHEMKLECARLQEALEAARMELESAKKTEGEFLEARRRLAELSLQFDETERGQAESKAACETFRKENAALHHDLAQSRDGQALIELRERVKSAEAETAQAGATLAKAQEEMAKRVETEHGLRAEVEALTSRCGEAERRAEAASESRVQQDNEVLRGILARQKAELEQRYAEAQRFRRAHVGLRLIYAAVILGVVAVVGLAIKVLPIAW